METRESVKYKILNLLNTYSVDKGDQIGLLDEILDDIEFEMKYESEVN